MQLFYSPLWSETENFFLSEEESRHCIQVLRHEVGDEIHVIDGQGNWMTVRIIAMSAKKVQLQFLEKKHSYQSASNLHIAISPTKSNERIEWFLEKACEIGIGRITPLICQRTERNKINCDRWNKIILSACKQAQILYLPLLEDPVKFEKFIQAGSTNMYIATIGAQTKLSEIKKSPNDILVIGPEGDFAEAEFKLIRKLGLKEVTLSENILRVETAGLVAVTQWNS